MVKINTNNKCMFVDRSDLHGHKENALLEPGCTGNTPNVSISSPVKQWKILEIT